MNLLGPVGFLAAAALACALAAGATAVAHAHGRARTAADAAALAAVTAAPFAGGGGDSCAAARAAAAANGARLSGCDAPPASWALRAVVSVRVPARGVGWLLPARHATAAAELAPDGGPGPSRDATSGWSARPPP